MVRFHRPGRLHQLGAALSQRAGNPAIPVPAGRRGRGGNAIVDLAPLVTNADFGTGDRIWLAGNPLSQVALDEQVPALRDRGVVVYVE